MKLANLPKITAKTKKRVGRGAGSGRGKTAGRGQKGQGARGKVKLLFEGGQLPLIKRLPLSRGKSRNKPQSNKPLVINVKYLDLLPQNSIVDFEKLVKHKIIKPIEGKIFPVKILGEGKLTKTLIVKLPCSKGAVQKIIKAGGKVESLISAPENKKTAELNTKKAKKQMIKRTKDNLI